MSEIKDGGPAFPQQGARIETVSSTTIAGSYSPHPYALTQSTSEQGMSIRDYFAAAALTGMLAENGSSERAGYYEVFSASAYEIADAMLKAREAKP